MNRMGDFIRGAKEKMDERAKLAQLKILKKVILRGRLRRLGRFLVYFLWCLE